MTSGIRQTDVWFIGGRTSMGKSVVGVELALASPRKAGAWRSTLEMPKVECQMGDFLAGVERNEPESRDMAIC